MSWHVTMYRDAMPRKTHTPTPEADVELTAPMMLPTGAPLMTIDDAAVFLRRSRATVYRLINSGALPTVHPGPGGYTRIRPEDLNNYVASTTRQGAAAS